MKTNKLRKNEHKFKGRCNKRNISRRIKFRLKISRNRSKIIKVPRINLSCGRKKSGNDKKLRVTNSLFTN